MVISIIIHLRIIKYACIIHPSIISSIDPSIETHFLWQCFKLIDRICTQFFYLLLINMTFYSFKHCCFLIFMFPLVLSRNCCVMMRSSNYPTFYPTNSEYCVWCVWLVQSFISLLGQQNKELANLYETIENNT